MPLLNRAITLVVFLLGLLFVVLGLRWLVNPAGIAPELGLALEDGVGLSSQIGDLSAFFLVVGLCVWVALVKRERQWYYPAVMLLLLAATGRIIAWVFHGAALTVDMIAVELIVSVILLVASRLLIKNDYS